ncbi:MAG: HEPN domain-containing protein [Prevotella sp.]|jgi:HEPN domain-containing protein|nr:HEPN domain-containing protein [Prevotella sp.]
MRKSITYLPKQNQEELKLLANELCKWLPQTVMIILYGSYVQVEYTGCHRQDEPDIVNLPISDYDILVVTSGISNKDAERRLEKLQSRFVSAERQEVHIPVQFVSDDVNTVNQHLKDGCFFYTQLKKEGIMLYNNGKYKLHRRKKLRYNEIRQRAQTHFDDKLDKADRFLKGVYFYLNDQDFNMASFLLHQVFESCYCSVLAVFTLRNNKQHNLLRLYKAIRHYSPELAAVFSFNDTEEKRLFHLVRTAYIQSRYNPHFEVSKEDIEALILKASLFIDVTKRVCKKRIKEYEEME